MLTTILFSDIFKMMLEFSSFCDAHFHLAQCAEYEKPFSDFSETKEYFGCTCSHDTEEFIEQEKRCKLLAMHKNIHIVQSFGIHPQNPLLENADFLEKLLKEKRIGAIGESGFDLFTKEFKEDLERQKKAWHIQLELAKTYSKPLVIHCRKGTDFIFADIKLLKNVPAVLFHSFFGGIIEARALIAKELNAYFSFGKQILNGNKKTISCVCGLPMKNLLLETDAPFQTLKAEPFTALKSICRIYDAAYSLREDNINKDDFESALKSNFKNLYGFESLGSFGG